MKDELPLWAEIDLGAVRRNVERLKGLLRPGIKLLAVVKANGYGHGDREVALAAVSGGADWLGVARVEEGAALRAAGISNPILLLAEPSHAAVGKAIGLDLIPTLYWEPTARLFSEHAARAGKRIPIHMKVDTGMHRYGVAVDRALSFFKTLRDMDGLAVEGVWSHFAVAEDVLNPYTQKQYESFRGFLEELGGESEGLIKHMANSAATLTFPDAHLDMVRCGIAVYGIHPSPDLKDRLGLEPVMSIKSRVGYVKQVGPDRSISYGQRYSTSKETTIATIPCGYADGLSRALTNTGQVLIRGRRYRISGTVTMDHFMVDAGDGDVKAGDEAVILGTQDGEAIAAQEIADHLDTIPYEIVCAVSARVPRIYVES